MPYHRTLAIALSLAAGSFVAAAAGAQSTPAPATDQSASSGDADTVRLTDEQRMKILDGNTEESVVAARGELPDSDGLRHGIHGEAGVMIGSHGTRGIYGAAEVPLGDHAAAAVSFESSQFGYRR